MIDPPFVSVIMPVRNEGGFIARSLGAVLAQDYPADRMEVIVADGLSNDGTRQQIEAMTRDEARVKLVDNPGKIVPTGFNAALREARGDVIVRVDGHTVIAADYVSACVEALERTEADNVGGRMNAIGTGFFGETVAAATSSAFGVGGARFHYSEQEEWVDTAYLGAWRRSVFARIGGFDEEFVRNQDDEFNYRLRASGGRILLSPAIRSDYFPRSTWRSLARQYYQYGYYKVRVMQKHMRQIQGRQLAPSLLVIGIVLPAIAGLFYRPALWLAAGVAALYVAANLAASGLVASRRNWKMAPLLPLVFATLHFGYGLGFLKGLVRFAGKWGQEQRPLVSPFAGTGTES